MHKSVEEEIEQFIANLSMLPGRNVAVLVEDREDIAFWERLMKEFAPGLKPDFPYTSSTGKDALRKYANHVSKQVLICADSDNDAYHQTRNSEWLNPRRPFIYQTYAHSRENHLIHPGNLQQECKDLIWIDYDFQRDFEEISQALFPWLRCWLFFTDEKQRWLNDSIEGFEREVSWGKLKSMVEACFEERNFNKCQTTDEARNIFTPLIVVITEYRHTLLQTISENGFEYLRPELEAFEKDCPIEPQEALWFIQGHCAFDEIMLPYFEKIVSLLSAELAARAKSKEDENRWEKRVKQEHAYRDLLNVSYRNCLTSSQHCRFFDQIKADFQVDFKISA
jgi:hypothetical protein